MIENQDIFVSDEKIALCVMKEADLKDGLICWLNDPEVVKYSRQRFKHHSLASSKEYLSSFTNTSNLYLKIIECKTQKIIGSMTVYFDIHSRSADIGILIGDKTVWGNGYGLRAWLMLMDYLFEKTKIREITGGCDVANSKMLAIFKRSGMIEYRRESIADSFSHYKIIRFIKKRQKHV